MFGVSLLGSVQAYRLGHNNKITNSIFLLLGKEFLQNHHQHFELY